MKIEAVRKKSTGERFIIINDDNVIPFGIAQMCVDRRISTHPVKCTECRVKYPLNDLNEGGYCEECVFSDLELAN